LIEVVHIPDGFLSTPVWATLDVAAAPAVVYLTRRAQRSLDENKVPLLGVLGAFVFAAQMINFPVGAGTTGHLVGGALLAFTLGPAPASVVMAAILAIQALVFQDGGILALGANITNMAVMGVLAGYLPFHIWGATKWRKYSLFAGGALSVLVSACLALAELLISGVRMPRPVLSVSLALFAVSAILEGLITLAVMQALERIQPRTVHRPQPSRSPVLAAIALTAVLLATVGVLFAAGGPDGIEKLLSLHPASLHATFLGQASAGILGLVLIYGACLVIGRVARHRSL
jgi:cobalt/nickel transport system permease protein